MWKSGIEPEKLLFMKLMVLRVGMSFKASKSIFPERPMLEIWRPLMTLLPLEQTIPVHWALHGDEF